MRMAKNSQRTISFGLWHAQTYDHHMLQSGNHLKPFQPLRELYNVEKQNSHHEDKEHCQQYYIVGIDIGFSVDLNMKALGERFGFEDI